MLTFDLSLLARQTLNIVVFLILKKKIDSERISLQLDAIKHPISIECIFIQSIFFSIVNVSS